MASRVKVYVLWRNKRKEFWFDYGNSIQDLSNSLRLETASVKERNGSEWIPIESNEFSVWKLKIGRCYMIYGYERVLFRMIV